MLYKSSAKPKAKKPPAKQKPSGGILGRAMKRKNKSKC